MPLSIYTSYDYLLHEFKHKGRGRKERKNRGVKKRVRKKRRKGGGEIRENWKWEGMWLKFGFVFTLTMVAQTREPGFDFQWWPAFHFPLFCLITYWGKRSKQWTMRLRIKSLQTDTVSTYHLHSCSIVVSYSSLPLSYDHWTTVSPHNLVYILHMWSWRSQPLLNMCI